MSFGLQITRGMARLVGGRAAGAEVTEWFDKSDQHWHRASAALASLLWAQVLGWGPAAQLAAVAIGWTFGGGRLSPDMDQYGWFKRLAPDRLQGRRGPLRHHGITHSVPLAGAVTVGAAVAAPPGVWLVPLQWVHHDLGDALIGKGGEDVDAGPSWGLWLSNWGWGRWKSGGLVCKWATVGCWGTIPVMFVRGVLA